MTNIEINNNYHIYSFKHNILWIKCSKCMLDGHFTFSRFRVFTFHFANAKSQNRETTNQEIGKSKNRETGIEKLRNPECRKSSNVEIENAKIEKSITVFATFFLFLEF